MNGETEMREELSDNAELLLIAGFRREVAVKVDAIVVQGVGDSFDELMSRFLISFAENVVKVLIEIFKNVSVNFGWKPFLMVSNASNASNASNVSNVSSSVETEILTALGFTEKACEILKLPLRNSLLDWLQNFVYSVWINVYEIYPTTEDLKLIESAVQSLAPAAQAKDEM